MLAFLGLNIPIKNYYAYEIDKYAIKTTQHNFPEIKELGDVFEANFTQYEGIDYLIGGSPCVPANSKIKTDKGYKRIADIRIGDMVLTHMNRYKPVSRLYKRKSNHLYHIKFRGNKTLNITGNHPIYVYRNNQFSFIRTDELTTDDYICVNINQSANRLNYSDDLLWLAGRTIADGFISKDKNMVVISVGKSKTKEFEKHLKNTDYYITHKDRPSPEYYIKSKELTELYSYFGNKKALDKFIPDEILNLPKEQLLQIWNGYISGDGFKRKDKPNTVMWCSSSEDLILSIGLLTSKLFGKYPTTSVRDGEYKMLPSGMCQTNISYNSQISISDRISSEIKVVGDKLLIRIKSIKKEMIDSDVYNIETAYDHSYTVDNIIVHNCTYWSIAQSPDKRETTASGLGWELFSQYVRALNEAKPKYFLYENNKSMSKAIYKSISDTFGFEPILINSALVSAQNRNRYYWCGKRNDDGTYSKVDIPQPNDRGILLKDILEGNFDREKSRAIIGSIGRTTTREYFKKNQGQMAVEPVGTTDYDKSFAVTAYYSTGQNAPHTLEKHIGSMVAEPVNITEEGKSQTIKAQYQQTSVANICKYTSTYGASGVAEPVGTTKDDKSYCLTSGYSNGSGEKIGNYVTHTLEKGCKSMVAEPVCMRYERSETAKRLRKDYESGKIKHGFHEHSELHPRTDGKSNTLSTVLKDNPICEPVNTTIDGKSQCLRATCYKDTVRNIVGNNVDRKTGVAEKVSVLPKSNNEPSAPPIEPQFEFQDLIIRDKAHIAINENAIRGVQNKNNASCAENFYEFTDTKANTLTTAHKPKIIDELDNYKRYAEPCEWNDNGEPTKAISFADGKKYVVYSIVDGQIEIKGKIYPIKLADGYYIIRKLTVRECMRLQTVPEWYDFSAISDTQAYKCLGNGWTVEVIKHLLSYMKTQ